MMRDVCSITSCHRPHVSVIHSESCSLSYAIAPVLVEGKQRVVKTNMMSRNECQISAPLNNCFRLRDCRQWSLMNMLPSLDNTILFVCAEGRCGGNNTAHEQHKCGRILLFSTADMTLLHCVGTHLFSTYWWEMESYACCSNITPALSWRGQHIALYTKHHIKPSNYYHNPSNRSAAMTNYTTLLYSLPMRTSLKNICRMKILKQLADVDEVSQLPLPAILADYLRFTSL